MKQTTLNNDTREKLRGMFSDYLEQDSLFDNKDVLKTSYKPGNILHRGALVEELASMLAPALKQNNPSNIFVYGKTGTGKTLVVKHVTKELRSVADTSQRDLNILYVNCKKKKVADTDYRLIRYLAQEMGEDIPATGLPTSEVYNRFVTALEQRSGVVVLVLDEIDALVDKISDNFLYNLTRLNEDLDNTQISLVGISNDLNFTEYMDARVRSSLSEEELLFKPYNAMELKDILQHRSDIAFTENALTDGVIQKCAAIAAQEHGDARRAIDLLRVAGELAEREQATRVEQEYVDKAREKLERDRVLETIKSLPKHSKIVLYTLLQEVDGDESIATGDLYDEYQAETEQFHADPLTQRRISDLINELDLLGIINAEVISKGRYGRTREITVDIGNQLQENAETLLEDYL